MSKTEKIKDIAIEEFIEAIRKLPFANQIKVFHTGFGMWQHNVSAI